MGNGHIPGIHRLDEDLQALDRLGGVRSKGGLFLAK